MFAAALLLHLGDCATIDDALQSIQAVRPAASPNAAQRATLSQIENGRKLK